MQSSRSDALLQAVASEIEPDDSCDESLYNGHKDIKFEDLAGYFDMPIQQVATLSPRLSSTDAVSPRYRRSWEYVLPC